jgi:DNA excision repair protein ERCC-6-like 2
MSFHSFKETLRSCSTSASASSSLSRFQPPSPLRKPPKSSIAHQLLRLDPTPSLSPRKEPTPDEVAREVPLEPPVHSHFSPRKPPKSSLYQQLQRLNLPDFTPSLSVPKRNLHESGGGSKVDEDEVGGEEVVDLSVNWRPSIAHSTIESRGPYEPLVLSAPGEGPLLQVMVLYQHITVLVGLVHCPSFMSVIKF